MCICVSVCVYVCVSGLRFVCCVVCLGGLCCAVCLCPRALPYPPPKVNACSPGFIETDLTRPFAERNKKTPSEMGMLPAAEGAKCPVYLAIAEVHTSAGEAWYYGSDIQVHI